MSVHHFRLASAKMAMVAAFIAAPMAHAQAAGAAATESAVDEGGANGEIVVTAQKRSERLQDVPLAVTAVSGEELALRQINDTNSLAQAVPSLTYQQGANPLNTNFRIRGVGTQLFSQGVESSVSVVVDGVVAARQAQGFAELADLERIEVLRGPQGTLFGKNASAGVINVVTARPAPQFEGAASVTVAEGDEYRAKATVTGPLSDTLRARLTGFYSDVGGHVQNVTTGRDVNGYKGWGVRGKLDWDASSDLNLLLTGDYRKQNSLCCASVPIRIDNPILAQLTLPVVASYENRKIPENLETYANSWQWTASLEANLDLGAATLTSLTAYQKYWNDSNQPVDRTNSDPVRYVGSSAFAAWDLNGGQLGVRQFSQELRLASNGNSDFTYVAGIYYSHTETERPFQRRRQVCTAGLVGEPCAAANIRNQSSANTATLTVENIAAFGQAEYRIAGGLKLIGGIRIQYEKGHNEGTQFGVLVAGDTLFPGTPAAHSGEISARDTALTGKAGAKYEFNRNAQVYATYTRGYKGRGYNMEAATDFTAQNVLDPEHVDAYEIGFKGATADRTLSFSAAIYRSDYTNLQIQANRSNPDTGVISYVSTNAGSSRAQGIEIEATLRPSEEFSMSAAFNYSESTVSVDGLNCPVQFRATAPILDDNFPVNSCYRARSSVGGVATVQAPQQDLRGATLPSSPRVRVGLFPRYETDMGSSLSGFVQVGINFTSKQQFAIEQDPLLVQPAYTLVDATLGLRTADDRFSASLFVKNLFGVNYFTNIAHNTLLQTTASPFDLVATFNKDADRVFGATFGVKF